MLVSYWEFNSDKYICNKKRESGKPVRVFLVLFLILNS